MHDRNIYLQNSSLGGGILTPKRLMFSQGPCRGAFFGVRTTVPLWNKDQNRHLDLQRVLRGPLPRERSTVHDKFLNIVKRESKRVETS